jgi:arginine deiminase
MPHASVTSEVGRLRRVLVHEPGPEVDRMVPAMMDDLLFDDILYGDGARAEHARFRRVLQILGVEVLETRDLLAGALEQEEARGWMREILLQHVSRRTMETMESASAEELAGMLVEGWRLEPGSTGFEVDELFEILPLPNWCFQRDPQVVLGDGVLIGAMATPARWREALLTYTIFRFHPELSSIPMILDPLRSDDGRPMHLGVNRPRFEGGDLLIISKDVVLVGYSQRTNRTGVRLLARTLAELDDGPRALGVVVLPQRRAYMHLDTLFTMIDRSTCLIYPPVMEPSGSEAAKVFEIDLRSKDLSAHPRESVFALLHGHGIELERIRCGGEDPVQQQREQWTDGANAFALAPGVIVLYDRNQRTADELLKSGFRVIEAEDLLLGREELDLDAPERACVLLPSHEMSRARGGPHCLTQPVVRDALA